MFPNQHCIIKKNKQKGIPNSDGYFHKYILDEERWVNELKSQKQELLEDSDSALKSRKIYQKVDTDICEELKEYKVQDILEHKRRQKLRNESHELRLLQNQLQAALVAKELAEQNKLLRKQKEMEIQRKREEDDLWAAECEKSKKALLDQEERDKLKKATIRVLLQEQMLEHQDKRKREFESVMKDHDEMQKTIKQIQAEEQAEKELAQRFRELCKTEMEECVRNREIQRQLDKEKNVDDNERLMAYQRERDELKNRIEAEKKRQLNKKMLLSEKIGHELAKINEEKKKREDLILSLLVEERKAKEDVKYRQNIERQIKEREKLRVELESYRNEIAVQKQRQFQEEERQMRQEYIRQMAERDKLDQLSDEKRRRKVIEHNKALREMIDLRRGQRAQEIADRIADFEKSLSNEKQRNQRIEEERIRILQSTPGELLRYLPPGVLKPTDREYLSLPQE